MFEMDDLIADLDLPGTAVSQIDDLCWHLSRETKPHALVSAEADNLPARQ